MDDVSGAAAGDAGAGGEQPPILTPYPIGGATPPPLGGAVPPAPSDVAVASRPRGRVLGVVLAVFALVAASGFVVANLGSDDGASSPEAAVESLFEALENRDVIGLLEVLPPSERSVLKDPMLDIVSELQRLEVLSDFDLGSVPGFEIEVDGLELSSKELGTGVASVRFEGGTITGRAKPEEIPIGDLLRDVLGDEFEEEMEEAEEDEATTDLEDVDFELVTIQEADGWHVSLWYSVAEFARTSSDDRVPVPDFGNSEIEAVGADTPEGAVEGLLAEATDLDLAGVIGMLPPDEMRVLYDYVPLFLEEADEAADDLRDEGFEVEIDDLDLRVEGSGNVRRVIFEGFALSARGGDDEGVVEMTWDGECVSIEVTYEDEWESWDGDRLTDTFEGCTDGTFEINGEEPDPDDFPFGDMDLAETAEGLFDGDEALAALTVVQTGGRWYVSPTRSLFDPILALLRGLDKDALRDFIEGMEDWFGSSSSMQFEAIGGEIGDGFEGDGEFALVDPGEHCLELWDDLDMDASDDEWDATSDAVDQCLEDAGVVNEPMPGDECYDLWDDLDGDASDEEWDATSDAVDQCLGDAGVDFSGQDWSDDDLFGNDAFFVCAMEMDDSGDDLWSDEAIQQLVELINCVEESDPSHPILPCFDSVLGSTNASSAEQEAVEADVEECVEEAMTQMLLDTGLGDFTESEPELE